MVKKTNPRAERISARITDEELQVLNFLAETTGKTTSTLLHEALREKYDFDSLAPKARDFFAAREQLIAQLDVDP